MNDDSKTEFKVKLQSLIHYVVHKKDCELHTLSNNYFKKCDCGLDDLLNQLTIDETV